MNIHVLGICGTFMGGVATLARDDGHTVTGSDQGVYPPMSTLLAEQGIAVAQGYRVEHLQPPPDLVIVGNALSRGNPAVEYLLDHRIPYVSGPQWLGENYLRNRRVFAVAGTHGKTTTTSMLAWILDRAGLEPGFLIGGVAPGFGVSARAGGGRPFVVEADEYDTAFFDKRSKFVHYRPEVLVLNNLEYDHADIFTDLAAIETQFHHLLRTVPGGGRIVCNAADEALARVLARGCWTPVETFGLDDVDADWVGSRAADGVGLSIRYQGRVVADFDLPLQGAHNAANAVAAVAAAQAGGVTPQDAGLALAQFGGVKRRLELLGSPGGIEVYDDFAHHPTAVAATIDALRSKPSAGRVLVALEPRSNTMRAGAHASALGPALNRADYAAVLARPGLPWDAGEMASGLAIPHAVAADVAALVQALADQVREGDRVVFMSNGSFDDAPRQFLRRLAAS